MDGRLPGLADFRGPRRLSNPEKPNFRLKFWALLAAFCALGSRARNSRGMALSTCESSTRWTVHELPRRSH